MLESGPGESRRISELLSELSRCRKLCPVSDSTLVRLTLTGTGSYASAVLTRQPTAAMLMRCRLRMLTPFHPLFDLHNGNTYAVPQSDVVRKHLNRPSMCLRLT